ncbi:hypothetical protein [Microbulbifer guangxiensis]|uniref:hypothetical protein n=1 Tax=Microbulbifer guangxiensis TaxID=2904249 RepID=UPI001F1AB063|nr:hypothetical protein [Microbulbifer guangxiensis]
MENIEIIKDKSSLEGTCYIELSLGKYKGVHWEETSLFFDEEIFGLIEPIFERNVPGYDHYSMNDADFNAWESIISDLLQLKNTIEQSSDFNDISDQAGFIYSGTRDYFATHYQDCKMKLSVLIEELVNWASINIKQHGYISILGI